MYHERNHNIGIWIVLSAITDGFRKFTKVLACGHIHHHNEAKYTACKPVIEFVFHAFIEGIPLANETEVLSPYLTGILFHNLPISFVLGRICLVKEVIKAPLEYH